MTLAFDAPIAFDSPDFTFDGLPLVTPSAPGSGRPVRIATKKPRLEPFVVIRVPIVGNAQATLGPVESHAQATITRVGVAVSEEHMRAHAVAVRFDIRADEDELLLLLS